MGGGSAGAALAARLSEDRDRRVALFEAGAPGPLDTDAELLSNVSFALTARDWGLRAHVTAERELDYPQGKFLGGGSAVNGALALRGLPGDHDGWAAAGNPLWCWERLLPCLRRLEHDRDFGDDTTLHGAEGPVPIVRWHTDELLPVQQAYAAACEASGLPWTDDLNHPASSGVGALPMNRLGGRRMSTALTYLAPALGRPNLTVRGHALVHRVRLAGERVVGVSVERDGRLEDVDAGEVILSAGAIHTPALLWRSGIGPAADLTSLGVDCLVDLPGVGANLTDHPGLFLFFLPGRHAPDLGAAQFQLGVRCTSSVGTDRDLMLSMMNFWDLRTSPDFAALVGAPVVVVLTCGVHEPRSRGWVRLRTADPHASPDIHLNLLDERADLERIVEGLRWCHRLGRQPVMRDFLGHSAVLDPSAFDDDAALAHYARNFVAPWYHPVGTCRMGPAADGVSVVDERLRVHGVANLRVVDASVMPRIVRAPTNLTTIAIAERAAELIFEG